MPKPLFDRFVRVVAKMKMSQLEYMRQSIILKMDLDEQKDVGLNYVKSKLDDLGGLDLDASVAKLKALDRFDSAPAVDDEARAAVAQAPTQPVPVFVMAPPGQPTQAAPTGMTDEEVRRLAKYVVDGPWSTREARRDEAREAVAKAVAGNLPRRLVLQDKLDAELRAAERRAPAVPASKPPAPDFTRWLKGKAR